MRVASGGHPPILIRRAEEKTEMIFHTGPALGMREDAHFSETRTELRKGDRMLLYTDGLLDGAEQGETLTSDQLTAALSNHELSGQPLLHSLLDLSGSRRGASAQEDDITMLLLAGTEAPSTLDNGTPTPVREFATSAPAAPTVQSEVLIGSTETCTSICIRGRGIWSYCPAFHDVCFAELKAQHPLTIDFSACKYLDSTFLGTIQEVVAEATGDKVVIRIQGVGPEVKHLFEELGMDGVIAQFTSDPAPMPPRMLPLEAAGNGDERYRMRILQAHEALAGLSDRNRAEFCRLIEGIRGELERARAGTE